ncbi:hypothetical protein F66182_3087 [Fusarium sp. NRRL 66182]|nr:hypothetical protein F66182_3087 [Fusarium sp. NRRL 66182]
MTDPPPYSLSASISRSSTSATYAGSRAEARLRSLVADSDSSTSALSTPSTTSTASTFLPPYTQSREQIVDAPSFNRDEPRTIPSITTNLRRLRMTAASDASNQTSSETRERIEMERDEPRRGMPQERVANDRLRREAGLVGLSAAEAKLRVLELKREAQAAADLKRPSAEGMFKKACATDLLFLMDTTGSMGSYIDAAKDQVKRIMQDLTEAFYEDAEVRIAVVGYKDHGDQPNIQFIDFTTDVDKVRSFIDKLRATGGGDTPEDVLGGIQKAINASWKNQTRCVVHIADAPPHGNILHRLSEDADDYYEMGTEPHKLSYKPLLKKMIGLNLNYALLQINCLTDTMVFKFLREYAAASADCKLLKTNHHYNEALQAVSGPRSSTLGGTGSAKGNLLFEEAQLGTTYSALRHLVVRSVTNSASRTAIRMSESSSRTDEKGGYKNALSSQLDAIGEDEDGEINEKHGLSKREPLLEDVEKQWGRPEWFQDKLVVEGFSPDTVVHRSGTLNDMMAQDDNIRLSVMELTVTKRQLPFAQGALRLAYCAKTAHSTSPYVVKSFKRDGKRLAHLAEDMRCQALCKAFALEFNALTGNKYAIDFIVTTCLKGKTGSGTNYVSLEPFIEGQYVKYNNNCSYVNEEKLDDEVEFNEAAQAFSHFTYERSWGSFLVCDLQGVGHVLTDPAIHTLDPERFKLADTNLGKDGFKFFFATHVCNHICRELLLKSKASTLVSENPEFREWWPTMDNTVCCSNKLCGKILCAGSANKSDRFPGCNWCDICWPQLDATKERLICVAPGTDHDFEVSRFYYESQGKIPPRKCPEHQERDETVARTAVMGGNFFGRLRSATKKSSISGKAW